MIEYFRRRPSEMLTMEPRVFEKLVAAIFKNNGFSVQLTPQTRDGGVDIIAVEISKLTGKSVHLIECKRYASDKGVGIGVVQRLLGLSRRCRAPRALSSLPHFFTLDAKRAAAKTEHVLTLRDYNILAAC